MENALRIIKRIMIITGALILLLAAVIFFYMRQPQFGKVPSGERRARIERSPHYKNGRFHNLVEKPTLSEGYSMTKPGRLFISCRKKYGRRHWTSKQDTYFRYIIPNTR
jgi:hypothetical protein